MTNLHESDASLCLPAQFQPATGAFFQWIYNDVLHHPQGPLRQAFWTGLTVAPIQREEGLEYSWEVVRPGRSQLRLRTVRGGGHHLSETIATEIERPPFTVLMSTWYYVACDLDMISGPAMQTAMDALFAFKQAESDEYGDTSQKV